MAVTLSLSITQNSQNVAGNTSNVTVKATASWTYGSNNRTGQCTGSITIDGTKHSFSGIKFNTGQTTSGSQVVMTKTVNVIHDSDGTKKLNCSSSFVTGVSSGTISASAYKTLTTIPRKSTLSVGTGTLGTSKTLTVTRQSTSFTHSIKAVCGNSTFYIKADGSTSTSEVKHSDCSIPFTPPLSLAAQNTTGTTVTITYTLTTYSGSTNIGTHSCWANDYIPASVKPSVSLAVSDSLGYAETFGGYVQSMSKLKIVVTASGSRGSTIKSYKTEADGKSYTAATVTTDVITGTGTLKVSTTVTDSRGRTATASQNISVLAYSPPKISSLSVNRCDAEGASDPKGEYLAITFDSTITPLNNKNVASYVLHYKKTTADEYVDEPLDDFSNQYSVSGGVYVLPAEKSSSYNITLRAVDSFTNTTKTGIGASISKGFSILKSIFGFAIGKVAELGGVFDVALQTRFTGGILHPTIEPDTDLDDVLTPNTYVGANVSTYNYVNCPLTTGTFTLEVVGMGEEGQLKQRLTYCHKTASRTWERIRHSTNGVLSWGDWVCVSDFDGQLLWEGGYYMTAGHTVTLSEAVSKQAHGIVLVFSQFDVENTTKLNTDFSCHFVPKMIINKHSGCGFSYVLATGNFGYVATKYLTISDDQIKGNDLNSNAGTLSGIEYKNNRFVLRYVIGV